VKNKGGRPAMKLKGKELILYQKELKKRRDAKYHQRRKNGELSNPASLENRKRRNQERATKSLQKSAQKLILDKEQADLLKENASLKQQLQKSATLLQENSEKVSSLVK
jgi:SPX domain protein involved in polyphosphate accumulation